MVAAEAVRQWRAAEGDADLAPLRREALAVDAQYRTDMPWWDGIDLGNDNVGHSVDGRVALFDLLCLNGAALFGQVP